MTEKTKTPMKAIREKCLDCCGQQHLEVKACSATNCPLFKFRLGLHPFTDKNKKNPFLEPKNFEGMENKEAGDVISYINGLEDEN